MSIANKNINGKNPTNVQILLNQIGPQQINVYDYADPTKNMGVQ